MLKWLAITLVVITAFMVILLGLGKLLHDNEQRVNAQLMQETKHETPQQAVVPNGPSSSKLVDKSTPIEVELAPDIPTSISVNKTIISSNLTCVTDHQCIVVEASFTDKSCKVAINTIGAAILAKAAADKTSIGNCLHLSENAVARCESNLCTIK